MTDDDSNDRNVDEPSDRHADAEEPFDRIEDRDEPFDSEENADVAENPFEDVGYRSGDFRDPFEDAGDRPDAGAETVASEPLGDLADSISEDDSSADPESSVPFEPGTDRDSSTPYDDDDRRPDEPLGDLAAEFDQRAHDREEGGSFEEPFDSSFEEMDAPDLDTDVIWSGLDGVSDADSIGDAEERRRVEVVPKRSYCQRCEHFTQPPETSCQNTGTEILELVDIDHFRVVNCPVAEAESMLREGPD